MGQREKINRKLDAWLGRGFKASKLKSLLGLTVSRLAVLRKQRRVRCGLSRRDVAQLLREGHQDRALLRAEYVIKDQNMLDAFAMVESYCHVVAERAALLENQRGCPDELREAIAGLIFAESRCGDLPELREVRSILAARLGKEFVSSAVELRNNCGVNPRIIQKLSTKQPSLENRVKVTRDIAAEVGVALHLDEPSSDIAMELTFDQPPAPKQQTAVSDDLSPLPCEEYLSESVKMKQRYKDAASAAQAAFESAAYAAAAARVAVELSRSESQDKGSSNGPSSPRIPSRTVSRDGGHRSPPHADQSMSGGPAFEKVHPAQAYSSESDNEQETELGRKPVQHTGEGRYTSPPESNSSDLLSRWEKRVAYDSSEEEEDSPEEGGVNFMGSPPGPPPTREPDSGDRTGRVSRMRRQLGASSDEDRSDEDSEVISPRTTGFRRQNPAGGQGNRENPQHLGTQRARLRYSEDVGGVGPAAHHGEKSRVGNAGMAAAGSLPLNRLGMGKGPVSMRTRRSGF